MSVAMALAIAACLDEGGVGVTSGETLFANATSVSLTWLHVRADHRREDWAVLGVSYGFREDLTASLVAPYLSVSEEGEGDAGLADVSLLAKYRFLFDGGERWEATAALVAGLQLPTGAAERDLDPELRLGSGSWDPFVGVAGTYEWNRFEVRGHALYQLNTEGADDFKHEDVATVGVGATWRPIVEKYPGPEAGISFGLTFQHYFGARDGGDRVRESGGNLFTAGVSAFWSPRAGIKFNASVEVPLAQDREEDLEYRLSAGGSYVF